MIKVSLRELSEASYQGSCPLVPRPSDFVGIILSDGPDSMPDLTKNFVKLPRRGPTIEVTFEGDEITTLYVNGTPVIVSPDVEPGDIVVKLGGTPEAYIMTDSFDTVKNALKLLEARRPNPSVTRSL